MQGAWCCCCMARACLQVRTRVCAHVCVRMCVSVYVCARARIRVLANGIHMCRGELEKSKIIMGDCVHLNAGACGKRLALRTDLLQLYFLSQVTLSFQIVVAPFANILTKVDCIMSTSSLIAAVVRGSHQHSSTTFSCSGLYCICCMRCVMHNSAF